MVIKMKAMSTTVFLEGNITHSWGGKPVVQSSDACMNAYREILNRQCLRRDESLKFLCLLGSGGQGVVYLSQRHGSDSFILPIAVKVFSPERYDNDVMYAQAMSQLAAVSARVAGIQHDNLLDVHNWISYNGIRIMEMELVDGFDLGQLLRNQLLYLLKQSASPERFNYINQVIITKGTTHPRLKPGVAVAIIRECLGALSALHRNGVVHGDVKPSNIMLKRTGHAKIVDIGSAFEMNLPVRQTITPAYAAPEVLRGAVGTPQSDLASLGYVLIDMLSGASPFDGIQDRETLIKTKIELVDKLDMIFPPEVILCKELMNFCRRLIMPDLNKRFQSAEAADLIKDGAANFHRLLIKGDLASEYDNDIRCWIEELSKNSKFGKNPNQISSDGNKDSTERA